MRINLLVVLPLALTAAFFGVAGWILAVNRSDPGDGSGSPFLSSVQQGQPAPPLDLAPLGDTPLLTRAALEGEDLAILNFFASWCAPCRAEHPTLTALAEAGVPLYGINYSDEEAAALGFLEELGNPYDLIGADPQAINGQNWGIQALPETFFIDAGGVVVLQYRGPIVRRVLDNRIRPALEELGFTLPELAPLEDPGTN